MHPGICRHAPIHPVRSVKGHTRCNTSGVLPAVDGPGRVASPPAGLSELHVRGRVTRLPPSTPRCSSGTHIFPACPGPLSGGHSDSAMGSGAVRRGRRVALWPSVTTPSRIDERCVPDGLEAKRQETWIRDRVCPWRRGSPGIGEIRGGTACARPDTVRGRRADRLRRRPARRAGPPRGDCGPE